MKKIIIIWAIISFISLLIVNYTNQHNLYQTEAAIFTLLCSGIVLLIILLIRFLLYKNKKTNQLCSQKPLKIKPQTPQPSVEHLL